MGLQHVLKHKPAVDNFRLLGSEDRWVSHLAGQLVVGSRSSQQPQPSGKGCLTTDSSMHTLLCGLTGALGRRWRGARRRPEYSASWA